MRGSTSGTWAEIRRVAHYWLSKPGYAAIIVITLGVGLGVNAGVLSFARAVLVEALPIEDADRVVRLYEMASSS